MKIQNDSNAKQIVDALRKVGAVVHWWIPAQRQRGNPDLVVCYRGCMLLIEVKGPKTPLTEHQEKFHAEWRAAGGVVAFVRTVDEALIACGIEPAF
jgi:Holliday junction resolvase